MLAVLLSIAAAATHHLGEPIMARRCGDEMLIYTKDNIFGLLEAATGSIRWTTQVPGIQAFDLYELDAVVAFEHYLGFVDADMGNFIRMQKHAVGPVVDISFFEDTVAVLGHKKLQVFEKETLLWEADVSAQKVNCTKDTVTCGDDVYDLKTGEKKGKGSIEPRDEYTFNWVPTVIEAYKNGVFVWRIDEPLYRAKLVYAASESCIVLTNATGIIITNSAVESVIYREEHLLSWDPIDDFLVFETENGVFSLRLKNREIKPYTGDVYNITQNGATLSAGGQMFVFPKGYKPACHATCGVGSVLSVATSGDNIISVVMSRTGKIQSLVHTEKAELGTCWCVNDSASVSYYRPHQKKSYIGSFAFLRSSSRGFATESLVIAGGARHLVMKNGRVLELTDGEIHGAVEFQSSSMWSPEYKPQLTMDPILGVWPEVESMVDMPYFAVQNHDIHFFSSTSDTVMTDLVIVGIAAGAAIALVIATYRHKARSFWE